ncbi:MAG: hypothetical protein ACRDD1_03160, partial [Planctomycetia bacterium]
LFFGEVVLNDDHLQIPHPRLHFRRFVLDPLAALAPQFVHPILRLSVAELLRRASAPRQAIVAVNTHLEHAEHWTECFQQLDGAERVPNVRVLACPGSNVRIVAPIGPGPAVTAGVSRKWLEAAGVDLRLDGCWVWVDRPMAAPFPWKTEAAEGLEANDDAEELLPLVDVRAFPGFHSDDGRHPYGVLRGSLKAPILVVPDDDSAEMAAEADGGESKHDG